MPRFLALHLHGRRAAFTLIELLIVVAIIAILAAIAVPNFMDAQNRAKVSRARSDHRSLALALEAYRLDQGTYPSAEINGTMKWIRWLTTPVAYIARVDMPDPFTGPNAIKDNPDRNISYVTYRYYGFNEMGYLNAESATGRVMRVYSPPGTLQVFFYMLFSHGPDRIRSKAGNGKTLLDTDNLFYPNRFTELIYDPTNGTVSNGEILRAGGNFVGRAAPAARLIQKN